MKHASTAGDSWPQLPLTAVRCSVWVGGLIMPTASRSASLVPSHRGEAVAVVGANDEMPLLLLLVALMLLLLMQLQLQLHLHLQLQLQLQLRLCLRLCLRLRLRLQLQRHLTLT